MSDRVADGAASGRGDPLFNQFLRLPRAFFRKMWWAALWRDDQGCAGSLLLVLALCARGYPNGATVSLARLKELSGLTAPELQRARRTLIRWRRMEVVEFLRSPRRGVWRFRLEGRIRCLDTEPRFYVPGRIVASGLWAELSPPERSVLLTLAALARAQVYAKQEDGDEENDEDEYDDDVNDTEDVDLTRLKDWVKGQGLLNLPDEEREYSYGYTRRVGITYYDEIAEHSGCVEVAVQEALERLSRYAEGDLLWWWSSPRNRSQAIGWES
jgi:hypothetical protein